MMKWYFVGTYSLLVPILFRPMFPNDVAFLGVCAFCGFMYGLIAALVKY